MTTETAPTTSPTRTTGTAPPKPTEPTGPAEVRQWALFRAGAVGIGVIWLAVAVISVFSPDLVTGSEQDHIPIAAMITWVWALVASRSLVITLLGERGRPDRLGTVWLLVGDVMGVWAVAAAVAVFGPEMVTGSDPTIVPICALLAPIAASVLTTTGCRLFNSLEGAPTRP
jgi:hypothetical protein